jgi:predicted PP-loop superfamily ATPase
MKLERILKRPSGKRVKITVALSVGYDSYYWSEHVSYCEKGKRKFTLESVPNHCTEEEIRAVRKELIDSIKID